MDFLFEDDDTTTSSRKNSMWIYWVDFEQEDGGAVRKFSDLIFLGDFGFFFSCETI